MRQPSQWSKPELVRYLRAHGWVDAAASPIDAWSRGELVHAVVTHQRSVDAARSDVQAMSSPTSLSGCTCGGIGTTGAHHPGCAWALR